MSWDVKIRRIDHVKPIEGADTIELCIVEGWPLVTRKGEYTVGDLAAYIPADSIVPVDLLRSMGLEGKLAGKDKNRVQAIRLRKQLSIGLLHKMPGITEGVDVAEQLGITKYEEPIPPSLSGVARPHPRGWEKFDIENINNALGCFNENDNVVITEKMHGSFSTFSLIDSEFGVHSKNISLVEDETNSYWKAARRLKIEECLRHYKDALPECVDIWLMGELIPVQDLKYGQTDLTVVVFDIKLYDPFAKTTTFLSWEEVQKFATQYKLPIAHTFYQGKYSLDKVKELTTGKEQFSGKELHIREGVVVKTADNKCDQYGRCIVKSVSPDYLMRQGGTECN